MESSKQTRAEKRIAGLEDKYRHSSSWFHSRLLGAKRPNFDEERELIALLQDEIVEKQDSAMALWFVNAYSPGKLMKAHGIDLNKDYAKLDPDIWMDYGIEGNHLTSWVSVYYPATEKNKKAALDLVAFFVVELQFKRAERLGLAREDGRR